MAMKPLIKVTKLNVTYFRGKQNEVKALKDVNLEIYEGEFVILFGPSGCGKSTLLYSVAGLEQNTEGEILFDQKLLSDMTPSEKETFHQQDVGMIFQAYYLIPSLSVLDNVALPQVMIGESPIVRRKKATQLLKHFGVGDQLDKLPNKLSGGQQQRVSIARALVNNPKVILADEPVGNLDSKSSEEVMRLLKQLNHKDKRTIVLVTHDPTHLHMADRVFYMKDGQIYDVKVNREDKHYEIIGKKQMPLELKTLRESHSDIETIREEAVLLNYKAREIVSDVLLGLSTDELDQLTQLLELQLDAEKQKYGDLINYLDRSSSIGGLDMDRRKVEKLVAETSSIVETIHQSLKTDDPAVQTRIVASHVLEFLGDKIKAVDIETVNTIVDQRLKNTITINEVKELFDAPRKDGGVGLDIRLAHRVSKRIEIIMLGRYHLSSINSSKNTNDVT